MHRLIGIEHATIRQRQEPKQRRNRKKCRRNERHEKGDKNGLRRCAIFDQEDIRKKPRVLADSPSPQDPRGREHGEDA